MFAMQILNVWITILSLFEFSWMHESCTVRLMLMIWRETYFSSLLNLNPKVYFFWKRECLHFLLLWGKHRWMGRNGASSQLSNWSHSFALCLFIFILYLLNLQIGFLNEGWIKGKVINTLALNTFYPWLINNLCFHGNLRTVTVPGPLSTIVATIGRSWKNFDTCDHVDILYDWLVWLVNL